MSEARSYVLRAVALCLVLCGLAVYQQNSRGFAQLAGSGLLGSKDRLIANMALTNRTLLQFQRLFNSMSVGGQSTSSAVRSSRKEQSEREWGKGGHDILVQAPIKNVTTVSRNKTVGNQHVQYRALQIAQMASSQATAASSVQQLDASYLNESVSNDTLNQKQSQDWQVGPVLGRKKRQRATAPGETQLATLAVSNTSGALSVDSQNETAVYAGYNSSASMGPRMGGNLSACVLRVKRQLALKLTPSREIVRQKLLASAHRLFGPLIDSLRYGTSAHAGHTHVYGSNKTFERYTAHGQHMLQTFPENTSTTKAYACACPSVNCVCVQPRMLIFSHFHDTHTHTFESSQELRQQGSDCGLCGNVCLTV
jgi:hypothetical protein